MKYDNLPVDVLKSVGEYLQTYFEANLPIKFFFEEARVEGLGPNTVEIRFDGPDVDEISNKQYLVTLNVDLLVTMERTANIFDRQKVLGICKESLNNDIPLYVNSELVGGLSTSIPFGGTEKIRVANYGQVHKDRQVLHSSVFTKLHILI